MRNYWNKIRKSKDGRVLLSNFGYLTLLQVAGYIFPFITIPYLAHTIGVDGYGKIAFAAAIIVWVKTITDWGFGYTATRDVAQNRADHDRISEIFSNTIWAQIFLMFVSFLLLLIAVFTIPKFWENKEIIFITFLLIPGRIMFPEWFFQGMERMRYITILNVISKFVFTLAVFVFIKEKSDYILQPLLTTLGYIVAGFFSMNIIIRGWQIKLKRPHFKTIFSTIRGSTDVFLNNLMPNFYNSFSIMLLGFWGGSISNGKMDAGGKLVSVFQQFMGVLSRTFFPFLSRRIDKHQLYAKLNFILSIIFTCILFFSAPFLIKLFFTPEFYDAISVLRIMSFSIIFLSLSNVYGTNYMIIQGHERTLRNITFFSSLIGFIFSFPLIYYFDFIGAALTVTLTRGILGITIMYKARMLK